MLAVIVLYNSKLEDSKTFTSLSLALNNHTNDLDLFVYDNSAKANYEYEKLKLRNYNIIYYHDKDNPGVSRAYNVAARYGLRLSKKWLMLLDQDTNFDENIFSSYQKNIESNPGIKLFVPVIKLPDGRIFSPSKYRFKRGFHLRKIKPGLQSLKKLSPVNSGMLIDLKSFFVVGGYNEKVKLDFSDFQFISRFKKVFNQFIVVSSSAIQEFSDNSQDVSQQLNRFRIYCECAKSCSIGDVWELWQYSLISFLRAFKLVFRFKTHKFVKIWFNSFLLFRP